MSLTLLTVMHSWSTKVFPYSAIADSRHSWQGCWLSAFQTRLCFLARQVNASCYILPPFLESTPHLVKGSTTGSHGQLRQAYTLDRYASTIQSNLGGYLELPSVMVIWSTPWVSVSQSFWCHTLQPYVFAPSHWAYETLLAALIVIEPILCVLDSFNVTRKLPLLCIP